MIQDEKDEESECAPFVTAAHPQNIGVGDMSSEIVTLRELKGRPKDYLGECVCLRGCIISSSDTTLAGQAAYEVTFRDETDEWTFIWMRWGSVNHRCGEIIPMVLVERPKPIVGLMHEISGRVQAGRVPMIMERKILHLGDDYSFSTTGIFPSTIRCEIPTLVPWYEQEFMTIPVKYWLGTGIGLSTLTVVYLWFRR